MNTTNKKQLFRQGDILLERVENVPHEAKAVPREKGLIVLAHGEVTNHKHAIAAPRVTLLRHEQATYLEVRQALADLEHEEHATIRLERGTYRVIRQREYHPVAIRSVVD